jgi:ABC-type sugar transport system ATPase subunit
MDEPLSNLDAQLRLQTRTELKRLHQELGTTMVYVTHDQSEAMTLGGRIAILHTGAIVQVGAPLELYRQPANTFVATFLGSPPMNLLDERPNGGPTKIGIRPEDVQLSVLPRDGWEELRALVVEPMGSEMLVTLERNGQRLVARAAADLPVVANTPVWVHLPPDRVLEFDGAGDRRR